MNKGQSKKADTSMVKSGEKSTARGRPSTSKGGSKSKSVSKSGDKKMIKKGAAKKASTSKSEVKAKSKSSKSKGKVSKSKGSKGKSSKGAKKGGKDKAAEEDVLKPSRPISAYIYYSNANVPKIKEQEGCSHKEAMSKCG
jgi:hypothetical protein